jgi:hypothetical protein
MTPDDAAVLAFFTYVAEHGDLPLDTPTAMTLTVELDGRRRRLDECTPDELSRWAAEHDAPCVDAALRILQAAYSRPQRQAVRHAN